jgi:hypothetical protein
MEAWVALLLTEAWVRRLRADCLAARLEGLE